MKVCGLRGLQELASAVPLLPCPHSPSTDIHSCTGGTSWGTGRESGIGMSCFDPPEKNRHPGRISSPLLEMTVPPKSKQRFFSPTLLCKYRTKLYNM